LYLSQNYAPIPVFIQRAYLDCGELAGRGNDAYLLLVRDYLSCMAKALPSLGVSPDWIEALIPPELNPDNDEARKSQTGGE
jgi:hypothetical protein